MNFNNYLTGTIFFVLLIWGPIDHNSSYTTLIRSSYLILIPLITWMSIYWIWKKYQIDEKINLLLNKILSGIISLTLFLFAVTKMTSDKYLQNDEWVQTSDGMEAVGDYVEVNGIDWERIIVLLIASTLFFILGVLGKGFANSDKKNGK